MINPVLILQNEMAKLKEYCINNQNNINNEEITKQMLILPFIKILGYNTKNPNEIKAEYSPSNISNSLKVDYCIYHNSKETIFIEAKSFGKNLNRYIDQMEKYYNGSDEVELGILTNGTEYYFFTSDSNSKKMNTEPFFTFDLLDYSIDDLETLSSFMKKKYNNRDMRLVARENRAINSIANSLYNILSNPDAVLELFGYNEIKEISKDSLNRIIPISIERSVLKKSEEIEKERENQTILKYSEQQLTNLGKLMYINAIDHDIFIPQSDKFHEIINTSEENYSVEKGNPLSKFFISKVYKDGKEIKGYLIGHFNGSFDENGEENIDLYCSPINNIEKFVKENPSINENGFINAKFQKRTNVKTNRISYYLQSNISGISFSNFPNLVYEINDFEDFYKEFFE